MKKVYVIFECDFHRSYESYCIKMLTSNYREALKHFKENKAEYVKEQDWTYNLASYTLTGEETSQSNALRDLEILLTTEE